MSNLIELSKCRLCEKEFSNPSANNGGITSHLKKHHPKFDLEKYYLKYVGKKCSCLVCGAEVAFRSLFKEYAKFCSISCSNLYCFENDPKRRDGLIKWGKFNGANQKERLTERNKTIESRIISSKSAKASWKNKDTVKKMLNRRKSGAENLLKFNSDPANRLHMKGIFGVIAEYNKTGIIMRSNLERAFATMLDSFKIKWVYEPITFKTPNGTQVQYTPDFCVNKNIYIEIKMKKHQTPKVKAVMADVLKQHGISIIILDKDDFFGFCSKLKS